MRALSQKKTSLCVFLRVCVWDRESTVFTKTCGSVHSQIKQISRVQAKQISRETHWTNTAYEETIKVYISAEDVFICYSISSHLKTVNGAF